MLCPLDILDSWVGSGMAWRVQPAGAMAGEIHLVVFVVTVGATSKMEWPF